MTKKTIIVEGKEYHFFDEYGTWEIALKIAKEFKKERKVKYFILETKDTGLLSKALPSHAYVLYLNKKLRIW